MDKDISVMTHIQQEKEAEIDMYGVIPLTPEGNDLAEHCLYTIDNPIPLVTKKADPKR